VSWVKNHPGELGRRRVATGRTRNHDPPARLERPDGVRPGSLADGLEHHVDPFRQPGPGLEDLVGTELEGPLALGLTAAGGPIR